MTNKIFFLVVIKLVNNEIQRKRSKMFVFAHHFPPFCIFYGTALCFHSVKHTQSTFFSVRQFWMVKFRVFDEIFVWDVCLGWQWWSASRTWSVLISQSTTVSCSNDEKTDHSDLPLIVLAWDDDPTRLVDRFNHDCHENNHAASVFVFGTLEQALNEAFELTSIEDVRLVLYVSLDRSLNRSSAVHCWSIFITKGVC